MSNRIMLSMLAALPLWQARRTSARPSTRQSKPDNSRVCGQRRQATEMLK